MDATKLTAMTVVAWLSIAAATTPSVLAAEGPAETGSTALKSDTADNVVVQPPSETPESLLGWLHRSLGTSFTLIFLALTLVMAALMVASGLAVRRDGIAPPGLIQGLELRLGDDRFHDACEVVRQDRSLLARVLAAGLPLLTAGDMKESLAKATSAMEEFGSLESIKLHARLGHVWLIAQLAPLFGLLGTINGLIATFDAIVRKGGAPQAVDLAGGIGTALVATGVGLCIAIASVAYHQIMLARLDRLLAEAGILAERFADQFAATSGREKGT